jgi:hypothetical protein
VEAAIAAHARSVASILDLTYFSPEDPWLNAWSQPKRDAITHSVATEMPQPAIVRGFVKIEVIVKQDEEPPARSRAIQAYGNLATQECFAREFTCLQKAIGSESFIEYAPGITVTFGSGLNQDGIASWAREAEARIGGCCVWWERDGKTWDATVQIGHYKYKEPYYRLFPGLDKFAKQCLTVVGKARRGDDKYTWSLSGTVKSGHNDTSLGNGIVNAAIAASTLHDGGYIGHIIVNGDDMLAAVGRPVELDKLLAIEKEYGINPVAAVHDDVSSASFCSGIFFKTPTTLMYCPKPGRLLAKLFWTCHPPGRKRHDNFVHSICCGVRSMVGELPIIRPWIDAVDKRLRIKEDQLDPLVYREKRFLHLASDTRKPPREDLMVCMRARYALSEEQIIEVEDFLVNNCTPGLVIHPTIAHIIKVDLGDFYDPAAN